MSELHLDTEGESELWMLGVATLFDPTILAYDRAASTSEDYRLFTASALKLGDLYLEPATIWGVRSPAERPVPPTGFGQVNSDLITSRLMNLDLSVLATIATSDDEHMSTMVFEKIAEGDVGLLLTGAAGGNIVSKNGIDVAPEMDFGAPIGVGSTDWLLVQNEDPPADPPAPSVQSPSRRLRCSSPSVRWRWDAVAETSPSRLPLADRLGRIARRNRGARSDRSVLIRTA